MRTRKRSGKPFDIQLPPETFEGLRDYIRKSYDQLLSELAAQEVNYAVPHDNVVALLEGVAHMSGWSKWQVWQLWAMRHVLPVHELTTAASIGDKDAIETMRKRLRDLLGYCVLGLVLCEKDLAK